MWQTEGAKTAWLFQPLSPSICLSFLSFLPPSSWVPYRGKDYIVFLSSFFNCTTLQQRGNEEPVRGASVKKSLPLPFLAKAEDKRASKPSGRERERRHTRLAPSFEEKTIQKKGIRSFAIKLYATTHANPRVHTERDEHMDRPRRTNRSTYRGRQIGG